MGLTKELDWLEPLAAVGDPPTDYADGNRSEESPPKGQHQVGDEARRHEGHPKDFALHGVILAANRRGWPAPRKRRVISVILSSAPSTSIESDGYRKFRALPIAGL